MITWLRILIVATGLAVIAVYLYFEQLDLLETLTREDGPIEFTQAGLYLLASVFFVIGLRRMGFRNLWYAGYALLFFVVAAEEISWGQRLLGVETPEPLADINVQGETNLHNIEGLHGSIRAAALMVTFGICFVIPLAYRWVEPVRRLIQRWHHPVFPIQAWSLWLIAFLFMAIPRATIGINFELDETGELYLALAMFVFGYTAIKGTNPKPADPKPGWSGSGSAVDPTS